MISYQVEVFTAHQPGAGTHAHVYLQMFGERGDSGKRLLLKSLEEGNKFESGKVRVWKSFVFITLVFA